MASIHDDLEALPCFRGDQAEGGRKGYPSETRVKRGDRTVHGNKELLPREVGPQ